MWAVMMLRCLLHANAAEGVWAVDVALGCADTSVVEGVMVVQGGQWHHCCGWCVET